MPWGGSVRSWETRPTGGHSVGCHPERSEGPPAWNPGAGGARGMRRSAVSCGGSFGVFAPQDDTSEPFEQIGHQVLGESHRDLLDCPALLIEGVRVVGTDLIVLDKTILIVFPEHFVLVPMIEELDI